MNTIAPNYVASAAFLQMALPLGPWQLTAIDPEKKKPLVTRTFMPGEEPRVLGFLHQYEGRNFYWAVNPPEVNADKKSEKKDIKQVGYLHVDLDPDDKLPLEQAQAEIRMRFESLPIGEYPPSFVIASGSGFQAFWKLDEPFVGDATEIERYNIQRAKMFKGDNCHDISRIMRLPGTVNWPDAKKQAKGRKPALASVHSVTDPLQSFSLDMFAPAVAAAVADEAQDLEINTNAPRLADINELDQWGVPDRVKAICVHGHIPSEPKKDDNSRSIWVMDAVCQLVRCSVPDEVIYSILTDPNFGISASVIEKGGGAERYAIRQIKNAHAIAAMPDWLRKMNHEYAYIGEVGGKLRIMWQRENRNVFMSPSHVKDWLVNRPHVKVPRPDGTEGNAELYEAWRRSPYRREYASVEFGPGVTLPDNIFNTWQGWKIKPPPEGASCEKFVDFILRVICNGDHGHHGWLMDWFSHLIQRPFEPSQVAPVLKGGEGIGKGFLLKRIGELVGWSHFAHISNSKNAFGDFNASLADTLLLFCDEIFASGNKAHDGEMKRIITEETVEITRKGLDPVKERRYFRTVIASNEFHVVNASADARRFFILYVNENMRGNWAFWEALAAEWDSGGKEAFFKLLQDRDISQFNFKRAPRTKALDDEKLNSLTGARKYVYEMLCKGEAPIAARRDGVADYDRGTTQQEIFVITTPMARAARASETAIGKTLGAISVGGKAGARETVDGVQRRGAWLLPLDAARGAFEVLLGIGVAWPEVDGGWATDLEHVGLAEKRPDLEKHVEHVRSLKLRP